MRNITLITNTFGEVSGGEKMFMFLVDTLLDTNKYNLDIISIRKPQYNMSKYKSIEIYSTNATMSPKLLWRFSTIMKLRRAINNSKPNAIVAFTSEAAFMSRIASLGMDLSFISCERSDPFAFNFFWKNAITWTYKNSDLVVFQMDRARDFFPKNVINKSYVIPNPFIPKAKAIWDIDKCNKTIVSAGRFVYQKGFDTLIKAFSKIHDDYPEYRLIIWGDGPDRKHLIQLARDYNIHAQVEMPGMVTNIPESIKNEGIFVLSSRFEGIPNVMLEAMSMGLPVAATDCSPGGAKFLSENQTRALISPVDDVFELAGNIKKLIENKDLAKRLSLNALNVRTDFQPIRISNLWVNAIAVFFND